MPAKIIITYISARPHLISDVLKNLFATAEAHVCVYVCYSGEEVKIDEHPCLKVEYLGTKDPEGMTVVMLNNACILKSISLFDGQDDDLIAGWCDDFIAEPGWGKEILTAYNNNRTKDYLEPYGMGFDLDYTQCLWYHCPNPYRSIRYLREVNDYVAWSTEYSRSHADSDAAQYAKLLNRFQYVRNAIVNHEHHFMNKREKDALDIKNDIAVERDGLTYQARRKILMDTLIPDYFRTTSFRWKESDVSLAILHAVEQIKATDVVETGTFTGCGSTKFLHKLTQLPIHTIEVSPHHVVDATNSLERFPKINITFGFSLDFNECYEFLEYDNVLNGMDFAGFKEHWLHFDGIQIDGLPNPKEHYKAELDTYTRLKAIPEKYGLPSFCGMPEFQNVYAFKKDFRTSVLESTFSKVERPFFFLDSSAITSLLEYRLINQKYDNPFGIMITNTNHYKHFRTKKMIEADSRMQIVCKNEKGGWLVAFRH